MTKTTTTASAYAELRNAETADDAATLQALQEGLIATQPLTLTRLDRLCALGEAMISTGLRRKAAWARVHGKSV